MPRSNVLLLVLAVLMAATSAPAQSGSLAAIEVQGGYAIPRGEFGRGDLGARPLAGPYYAAGARIRVAGPLAVYGRYKEIRFGCANCVDLTLANSMIARSGELGVDLRPFRPFGAPFGMQPWFRAGGVYHTLGFSGGREKLTSRAALGIGFGAGVSILVLGRVELIPGLGFVAVPAEFEFTVAPSHSMEVRSLTLEVGAAVRVRGRSE